MSNAPIRIAAGFILFRQTDDGIEFLMLRNALHHTWGFPKGHQEPGEDERQTALRETREETGITQLRPVDEFHEIIRYPVVTGIGHRQKQVSYFLAEVLGEPVRTSAEHDRVAWVTCQKVRSLITHPSLHQLFDRAVQSIEIQHRCREQKTQ